MEQVQRVLHFATLETQLELRARGFQSVSVLRRVLSKGLLKSTSQPSIHVFDEAMAGL
jgi:hypothetical protein